MHQDLQIHWNGECVGQIKDFKMDMFHYYGAWEPADSTQYFKFISAFGPVVEPIDPLYGPEYENDVEIEAYLGTASLGRGYMATLPGKEAEVTIYAK